MAKTTEKRRIQIELTPTSYDRVQRMKDKMDVASITEVVRDALRLLEFMLDEHEQGKTFQSKDKEGNVTQLKLLSM